MITIALPTGRVLKEAIEILEDGGLPVEGLKNPGRELVIEEGSTRYILAKPMDVPLYVHRGVADLALAGSDVLWESGSQLVELLDTGRGLCSLQVAGPPELSDRFKGHRSELMGLKVATKYPEIADRHFSRKAIQIDLVHLNGSIELAPRLGLTDCILDIVQTGSTLKANGLVLLEYVAPVSLRLVASRKGASTMWDRIGPLVNSIKKESSQQVAS
ncbi:ATP phosphoribosyltransferase [Dethiosulfovibrio salsuginis]|uniref:ATP phosphoribosyltransferase n=1 Tax=Dethiosulfovibrio salsuginis TaxID=561720 RepID=A0A1X7ITW8_9BACT|nr:ATP phosphoribosyltransferase [Dethiosulfovibrio salsuginis]SMG18372.1 ATP phosphoribosyltransferase [Dethiosulfovibrio salsuginis]